MTHELEPVLHFAHRLMQQICRHVTTKLAWVLQCINHQYKGGDVMIQLGLHRNYNGRCTGNGWNLFHIVCCRIQSINQRVCIVLLFLFIPDDQWLCPWYAPDNASASASVRPWVIPTYLMSLSRIHLCNAVSHWLGANLESALFTVHWVLDKVANILQTSF